MEKIKLKYNSLQLLMLSSFLLSQLFFTSSYAGILFKREINYDNNIRNSSTLSNNKNASELINLNNSQIVLTTTIQPPKSIETTAKTISNLPTITTTLLTEISTQKEEITTIASTDAVKNSVETTTELMSIFGERSLFSELNNEQHNGKSRNMKKLQEINEKLDEGVTTITPLTTTANVLLKQVESQVHPKMERLQELITTTATPDTTTDMFSFDYSKYLDPYNFHEPNSSTFETHRDNDVNTSLLDVHSTLSSRDFDEKHKEYTNGDDFEFKSFQDFDLSKPTVITEHSSEVLDKGGKNGTHEKNSTVYLNNLEVVETKYDMNANAIKNLNHTELGHDSSEIMGSKETGSVTTEKKAKFLDPSKDLRLQYPIDSDVLNLGETYVIKHDQLTTQTSPTNAIDGLWAFASMVQRENSHNKTGIYSNRTSMVDSKGTNNTVKALADWMEIIKNVDYTNDSYSNNAEAEQLLNDKFNHTKFPSFPTLKTQTIHEDTHSSENRIAATSVSNATVYFPLQVNATRPIVNLTEQNASKSIVKSIDSDVPPTKVYEKNTLPTDESFVKIETTQNIIPSTASSKYEVRETPDESMHNMTDIQPTMTMVNKTDTMENKTVKMTADAPVSTTLKTKVTSMLDETTTEFISTTTPVAITSSVRNRRISTTRSYPSSTTTFLPIINNEILEKTTTLTSPIASTLPTQPTEKTPVVVVQQNPTTDSSDPSLNELTPKATTVQSQPSTKLPISAATPSAADDDKLQTAPSTNYPSYINIRSGTTTKMTPIDSTLEINTIDKSTEAIRQNERNERVHVNPKINGDEYKYNTVDDNNRSDSSIGSSQTPEIRVSTDINEHTDDFEDQDVITTTPNLTTASSGLDTAQSEDADVNFKIAIIVSIIGFIALLLLIAFLFIMRKRQKQLTYGQRCRPVSLDDYNLDNVSIYNSVRRKANNLRLSKRSYGNSAFEDPALRSNLLTIPSLATFVQSKHSIHEEFKDIPQITARADEVPAGCEDKNRYANVIPLPETRVHLSRLDNDEKTEYINANFVKGPKDTTNYYIATQAPLESTISDFWRMIWEQNSKVIVMATDLTENGVEKCAEYLPPSVVLDNNRLFGDFQVTLKNREVKEKYAISTVHLRNSQTKTWREIVHFWYQWPDTNVPIDETSIIAMLLEARSHLKLALPEQCDGEDVNKNDSNKISDSADMTISKKDVEDHEENAKDNNKEKDEEVTTKKEESAKEKESKQTNNTSDSKQNHYSIISNGSYDKHKSLQRVQGPLTVHCSPGTGRTGTIISCDIALRILEIPPRQIDVPQTVYYVRRGRANAVRTKEQYEFIYRVANVYATKITGPSLEN